MSDREFHFWSFPRFGLCRCPLPLFFSFINWVLVCVVPLKTLLMENIFFFFSFFFLFHFHAFEKDVGLLKFITSICLLFYLPFSFELMIAISLQQSFFSGFLIIHFLYQEMWEKVFKDIINNFVEENK